MEAIRGGAGMSTPVIASSALALTLLGLVGCGGASHSAISTATVTGGGSGLAVKTFSAAGIALHFTFPASLRTMQLAQSKRVAGNAARATHAAVGTGNYDLLIVTRFPRRPIPVTARNLHALKPQFDRAMSAALGQPIAAATGTVGGLPALSYPPAAVEGLPVKATSRITEVFVGDDEYELNCQYTAKGAPTITAACNQMLATLRTGG
jgi:hypothetical protein